MDFSKHIQKAEEALRRRNHDFAVELYRQLVDLDPDQGEARAGLRRALKLRHETKRGGRFLGAVAGALPLGRARTMSKLGKHEACARALEDYLTSNPLDEEANLLLGISLEKAGHFRSARSVYEFVADIAPRNPDGLKRAGAMMYRTGDHARALDYYERALEVDPRDQEALKARKNLAAESALARNTDESVQHSRELARDTGEMRRLERHQRLRMTEDELRQELTELEGRLHEHASDPDLLQELSGVHESLGDVEAALEFAERALSYRKDAFELFTRVGDLKVRSLKRALAQADKEERAEDANRLEGELHAFELDDARARVERRPGDAGLRLALARKLLRLEELDAAISELQRCQNDPRIKDEALFLLGKSFQRKGIHDLARKQFERALESAEAASDRAKEILYALGTIAEAAGNAGEARSFFLSIYEVDIAFRDVAQKMKDLN